MIRKRFFISKLICVFLSLLFCSELNENHPNLAKEKCESCHLLPPSDDMHTDTLRHPFVRDFFACKKCHTSYTYLSEYRVDENLHNNGKIDVDSSRCVICHKYNDCNSCHKSPPLESWNSKAGRVHSVHYNYDKKLSCNTCHKGYDLDQKIFDEKLHDNGNKDVIFDVIKKNPEDPNPFYQNGVCYNLYCHGASTIGGRESVAIEERMGSGIEKCSFCHNIDALREEGLTHSIEGHKTLYATCLVCHPGFSCTPNNISATESLHRNGVLDTIPATKCFECHMTITH